MEILKSIIQFLLDGFWSPNFYQGMWNLIPGRPERICYLYTAILSLFLGALLYGTLTRRFYRREREEGASRLISLMIIVFVVVLIIQTTSQTRYFIHAFQWARHKELKADHASWGSLVYTFLFAKYCKIHLPGDHQGYLISNHKYIHTLEEFVLAYYLYPQINILENNSERPDCYIVFLKPNPEQYLPKDSKIVGKFGNDCLIAVRK